MNKLITFLRSTFLFRKRRRPNAGRRLVTRQQYVKIIQERLRHQKGLLPFLVLGLGGGGACIFLMCSMISKWLSGCLGVDGGLFTLVMAIFMFGGLTGCSFLVYVVATECFEYAKSMEPVAPISERNAHRAPLSETLVRGSDVPLTNQQGQLLRAAQRGVATPPEQLLRAEQREREP